jgi:hypothetical protein
MNICFVGIKNLPVLHFICPCWTGRWSAPGRAAGDIYCTSWAGLLGFSVAPVTNSGIYPTRDQAALSFAIGLLLGVKHRLSASRQ